MVKFITPFLECNLSAINYANILYDFLMLKTITTT